MIAAVTRGDPLPGAGADGPAVADRGSAILAAVLLINHHGKHGASGANGEYRVPGQIGFVGVCRANSMFLPDPDDPTGRRRLMLHNGGNLAPEQPALRYVVRDEGGVAVAEWLPETIDLDADAALARAVTGARAGGSGRLARRHACEEWLRGYLADGPKPAHNCDRVAVAAGFNRRLLERARAALAIQSVRSEFGKGSCYYLCLPDADGEAPDRLDVAVAAHTPPISA